MVRVRFAPSPTGALHIGGVRTALYNYLFAKKMGGEFLLRIEDTDSGRYVAGAEQYIIEALSWCGIQIDEGVSVGGPHAPYRQSERRDIYLKYALELVDKGWAYYAFDTAQVLGSLRELKQSQGGAFAYNFEVREQLETSLRLTPEQVRDKIAGGEQYVIRFKMPVGEVLVMQDLIRGQVRVDSSTLDDKVLYKSHDALPTYHLANIVDDHLMEITHVIRGEEWLPSLPLHFMLYRAFGWERPEFAHLPLILKPDGKGKLSKRDGDKLGFAVFPLKWTPEDGSEGARGFREDGYLPTAFINMLALLGWAPGGDREIMTMEEMIRDFSIERIGKAGARYDPDKARWINAQYIRHTDNAELATYLRQSLQEHGVSAEKQKIEAVCGLIKERATLLTELWELSRFYFIAPNEYDEKVVKKFWKPENSEYLRLVAQILADCASFDESTTEAAVKRWIEKSGISMGAVMNTLRLAIVGGSGGASIFAITQVIGREDTLDRIARARKLLD